jgi:hypothetical protein
MFDDIPGTPGLRQHTARTTSSIETPASLSGRGQSLAGKAVPKLRLTQRG